MKNATYKYMICCCMILASCHTSLPAAAEYNPATGEDELVFVSQEQEVTMGNSLSRDVEKKFGLAQDEAIQQRVNTIGRKIALVCDRKDLSYSFRVLDGEELEEDQRINAFALPGGYVYIFEDMVKLAGSDDELASILAHEVGHIAAKHSIKKLQNSIGMAGIKVLSTVSAPDRRTSAKSSAAIAHLMMAYNRQAEFEADKLSVRYLKDAGFDPKGAAVFMDKMLQRQLKGKLHRYMYFRSHPYTSERKAMLDREIEGAFTFDDYINTTEDSKMPQW